MSQEKPFFLISPTGFAELTAAVGSLAPPGGMVHIFDAEAMSLITVSVDKRSGRPIFTGWSVCGPMDGDEARRMIDETTETTMPRHRLQ